MNFCEQGVILLVNVPTWLIRNSLLQVHRKCRIWQWCCLC